MATRETWGSNEECANPAGVWGGSGQACDQPVPLRCTLLPD